MFRISDLCPISFNPQKYKFARETDYIQRFYSTDTLLVQIFIGTDEKFKATLNSSYGVVDLLFTEVSINDKERAFYCSLTGLSDGVYTIKFDIGSAVLESEPFAFCSSYSVLEETSLIRYSHNSNSSIFDTIFFDGDKQLFYEFRVEAGFKPSGTSFKVAVEQFRNQYQHIIELYSVPYKSETLTVGDSFGVPVWVGELLNRIFSTKLVTINGKRYVRSESSVPEMTAIMEGEQMFNMTMTLERIDTDVNEVVEGKRIFDHTFSRVFG